MNVEIQNEVSFKQVLANSSSIQTLLSETEIKKWHIPINKLKMGETIGQGAFGLVVYASLSLENYNTGISRRSSKNSNVKDNDSGIDSNTVYTHSQQYATKDQSDYNKQRTKYK
jgi:hypothetical protein